MSTIENRPVRILKPIDYSEPWGLVVEMESGRMVYFEQCSDVG